MKYFTLLYHVVDDFASRRLPFREEHLRLAREASQRGELRMGGALGEPPRRALLVFYTNDQSIVQDFVKCDPYVINGLVTRWEVEPWAVVIEASTAETDS